MRGGSATSVPDRVPPSGEMGFHGAVYGDDALAARGVVDEVGCRSGIALDRGHRVAAGGGGEREEPDTGVEVEDRPLDPRHDVLDQRLEQVAVALEEGAGAVGDRHRPAVAPREPVDDAARSPELPTGVANVADDRAAHAVEPLARGQPCHGVGVVDAGHGDVGEPGRPGHVLDPFDFGVDAGRGRDQRPAQLLDRRDARRRQLPRFGQVAEPVGALGEEAGASAAHVDARPRTIAVGRPAAHRDRSRRASPCRCAATRRRSSRP